MVTMRPLEPKPVSFKTPAAFRAWLRTHHSTAKELIIRLYRVHVSDVGIGYAAALDEALCYGWIDGIRRSFDADSFTVRFTPRKPRSIWSKVNVAHVKRLQKAGRMTRAGEAAFAARQETRTGIYSFEQESVAFNATYEKRLRANRIAWKHFQNEAPSYRRLVTHWVMSAKREETRVKRLEILIASAAAGLRIPSQRPS